MLRTDVAELHGAQHRKDTVKALTVVEFSEMLHAHGDFTVQHIFRILSKGLVAVRGRALSAPPLKEDSLLFRLSAGTLFPPTLRHPPSTGIGGELLAGLRVAAPIDPYAVGDKFALFVLSFLDVRHFCCPFPQAAGGKTPAHLTGGLLF